MASRLLEADLFTVDLSAIAKNKNSDGPVAQKEASTAAAITDWSGELDRRLADNRALSREARKDDYQIEVAFFEEYFTSNPDFNPCGEQLITFGGPLHKAIKVLGFDKNTNPILAFIVNNFVKNSLIKPGLLNATTFRAIYTAVAQKLVAQSQFLNANDYNIIYCKDLYKMSVKEILEYLSIQNQILPAKASRYTKEMLNRNKQVFAAEENVASIQDAKLKSKKDITETLFKMHKASTEDDEYSDSDKRENVPHNELTRLARDLKSPALQLAALQFLTITTKSKKAKEAFLSAYNGSDSRFTNVNGIQLLKASDQVAKLLQKKSLSEKEADTLVTLILK